MRKILGTMIFIIVIASLTACSNKEETNKELDQEVNVELEDKDEETKIEKLSVKNKDTLYEFLEEEYNGKYTGENFDLWQATYLDIDKDGIDEVAFTAPYGEGNLKKVLFVRVNDGEYQIIPSNIDLEKYENEVGVSGDFIRVYQASGGSGLYVKIMGIYKYDGKEIFHTGVNLIMEDVLSMPDGYEALGEVEGNLNDFIYTLTKESLKTGEITIEEKSNYIYRDENKGYEIESLMDFKEEKDPNKMDEIQMSLKMTKEEIIDLLGNKYEINRVVNEMDGGYVTSFEYSDIVFEFLHDSDNIASDTIPTIITIKSNKYKYNYDVKIGDNAIKAIEKCEESMENLINPHGLEDEELPDWFYYKEDEKLYNMLNGDYIMRFEYDTGERYMDKSEIPGDAVITSIMLLGYYN